MAQVVATCKEAGVPVGNLLADQLILPFALAGGGSFKTVPLSWHAQTNIEVVKEFLDIYVHVAPEGSRYTLDLVSPLGGPKRTLVSSGTAMGGPSWAPDGRALALNILSEAGGPGAVWAVRVDTGERRQVTWPPAGIPGDRDPTVSPDGKTVAFCRVTAWRTAWNW